MTSLPAALQEFLYSCQADGLSKATQDWYRWLLTPFVEAHEGTIKDITTHALRQYIIRLRRHGYAENTVNDHMRALHRFWKWCSDEYEIRNPMRAIKYPSKPEPKPKAASLEDVAAMLAVAGVGAMGARNRAILVFMLDSGCRAAGVINLKVSDLSLNERRALVTEKGDRTRYVMFTSYTAMLLSIWMELRNPKVEYLFYDFETLEPLLRNGLYQMFRRLAKRAGVKGRFNPHSLRHTFAREYIKNGGDLATLAKLLGHRDVSTTVSHYAIFTDAEIAEKHEKFSPANKLGKKE